ncbi:DUF167 domain-containing protein [Legionella worsleiensis]|uniref:UPF0235 protein Lwor_1484 n=1 Tax=Legionella worsleiensis TaxID=45076 RepID=A0A0W1AF65_9GAMM|nr:DUF167 domain-containing protein [Legionella worsleiensis]KTD79970.1 hypothetical protein Lwor_1484 [Legionella worsleiensis]STY32441.1 Uncharacterised ACR, YggU family COG1872 [Legionella worsleiensis]
MWFKVEKNYVFLTVYAKPNAKKSALLGITNDALQIALHAKPQNGQANTELLQFIAKKFKVPKSHCELIRGDSSRHKQIRMPWSDHLMQLITRLDLPVIE